MELGAKTADVSRNTCAENTIEESAANKGSVISKGEGGTFM